jgi:uncharacterized membrane protein YfcA
MQFLDYVTVFVATAIGETFGALFGGGGLFIQPVLLLVGVSPHQTVANDVASAAFSSFFFTLFMHRQGHVNWKISSWMAPAALAGAIIGSLIFVSIPSQLVAKAVLCICAIGLCYMVWRIARKDAEPKERAFRYFKLWPLAASAIGLLIGLYDGVSGVASGILLISLISIALGGSTKSVIGTANAVSAVSLFVAGTAFFFQGLLSFPLLAVMIPANMLAAYMASRVVKVISEKALRMAFIAVAGTIVFILGWQQLAAG